MKAPIRTFFLGTLLIGPTGQTGVAAPLATFTDPVAYCRAVGTVDRPTSSYVGHAVPGWIHGALDRRPEDRGKVVWRCAGMVVLACADSGNDGGDRCRQYSLAERTPDARGLAFCRDPAAEGRYPNPVGHPENWRCMNGLPVRQSTGGWSLDARGFRRDSWIRVTPALEGARTRPMDQSNFTLGERRCYDALRAAAVAGRSEGTINFNQKGICSPEAFRGTKGPYRVPDENGALGEACFQVFRNARLDHDAGKLIDARAVMDCDLGDVEEWWALDQ